MSTNDETNDTGDERRGNDDSVPLMDAAEFAATDALCRAYFHGDEEAGDQLTAEATARWERERRRRARVEAAAREVEERRQRYAGLRGHSRVAHILSGQG